MNTDRHRPRADCCSTGCCAPDRREFLKFVGLGAAAAAADLPAMAGPFTRSDFDQLVPADKKLSPEWVRSLFARGARQVYRGDELDKIGMPIGGICAGQLYLGGDGRLWCWEIFNQHVRTAAEHYAHPRPPASPLEQGFGLKISAAGKAEFRRLDRTGFSDVSFCGEYPIGCVEYRDAATPVTVALEAFSPFVPLNADDSSLPATILRFTVQNTGREKVEAELLGWLENAVCGQSGKTGAGERQNRIVRQTNALLLDCAAVATAQSEEAAPRTDIVFEDFQKETYQGWDVTGTAFGSGPILKSQIPAYQGDVGARGPRVVNSHASAPGHNVAAKDGQTGTLTSPSFRIERNFIYFWIGGGNHPGKTCINLLVDGKVVRSATGQNSNQMRRESFAVYDLQGQTARLAIVDSQTGPWGNIGIAEIIFSDKRVSPPVKLAEQPDFGTLSLGLLEPQPADLATAAVPGGKVSAEVLSDTPAASERIDKSLVGALGRKLSLAPGQAATVTFVVAWHFPNLAIDRLPGGRRYATRFPSAAAVVEYVAANFPRLARETRLWHDTWYDSTLPYWFLDRTFANASILASNTCHWFRNGRFYGWEGVGCCPGTCAHVWHYAHAPARLFPELERSVRETVDFGLALDSESGAIGFRGEFHKGPAGDGQAGCILRALREHQMSADDGFLRRVWPNVKKALEYLIAQDADGDGILAGRQHNTLDADWYGPVAWLTGLYLAALRAGEEMAREMGDEAFARQARAIFERGTRQIVALLFDGDYFINRPDPEHAQTINSGTGCEIDQVFGQSWAFQVGLGRVLPESPTRSALRSLWKYNFSPDVGPYRDVNRPGRWYAMAGEAGLLMCTFPRTDWDYDKARGKGPAGLAGYFNECMTGFEYQVAGHMLWEGMVQEGLAITRAIHDRYHAARRNPWNEVECGDHYARAMASYGVFLAACGYECHGPRGHLAFAPRLTPDDFRAPFTAAEAWGTFVQQRQGAGQRETIAVKWGRLRLRTLAFVPLEGVAPGTVTVTLDGKPLAARHTRENGRVLLHLDATVPAGSVLEVVLG